MVTDYNVSAEGVASLLRKAEVHIKQSINPSGIDALRRDVVLESLMNSIAKRSSREIVKGAETFIYSFETKSHDVQTFSGWSAYFAIYALNRRIFTDPPTRNDLRAVGAFDRKWPGSLGMFPWLKHRGELQFWGWFSWPSQSTWPNSLAELQYLSAHGHRRPNWRLRI